MGDDLISTEQVVTTYLKAKAAGKVSLTKAPYGFDMHYSIFDKVTGELVQNAILAVNLSDLNDQKTSLQSQIDKIDLVLSDVSKL